MGGLRGIDMFRKIPADLTSATTTGAILSVAAGVEINQHLRDRRRLCGNQNLRRVLNHRVVLHAIDATPAGWRGDAGSSPLDRASTAASSPRNDFVKNYQVHPTLVDFHTGSRSCGRRGSGGKRAR